MFVQIAVHHSRYSLRVVIEDGFLRPAGGEEGLADELLDIEGDGTAAAVG